MMPQLLSPTEISGPNENVSIYRLHYFVWLSVCSYALCAMRSVCVCVFSECMVVNVNL